MRKALKIIKIIVDVLMLGLFLYLMAYRLIRAMGLHAIFGIVLFSLFLIHHLLNYRYYLFIFKGKYGYRRMMTLLSDILLLIDMVIMAISAVMMSNLVIDSGVPLTQSARDLHMLSTSWGFLIMAFHLGIHLDIPLRKLERKAKDSIFQYLIYVFMVGFFAIGIFSLFDSGLNYDLFLIMEEKNPSSWSILVLELASVILSMCLFVHGLLLLIDAIKRRIAKRKQTKDQR